jgi:hypothetical protein
MSFFPSFSNIDISIKETLDKRKGNPLEVSKLNVWVKLTSAVGNGLILYSNPDYKLFNAAGDGNISTIYGSNSQSGVLGVDWNDNPVRATNSDLPLQPRPVVTSIEIDEGAGNISRKATISITAFTKGQAELVSEYFLEPGFTVFFEFGWNDRNSVGSLVKTSATEIAKMQDIKELIDKRINSKGTYENYLGYITGGSISVDGTVWNITVNLTGFTEIPLYLKTHEGLSTEEIDADVEKTSKSLVYKSIRDNEEVGLRLFKMMFNELPPIRQIQAVKDLEEELANELNFINFDDKVREAINDKTDGIPFLSFLGGRNRAEAGDQKFKPPTGTEVVDEDKFIRFGAMMKILQTTIVSGFKLGDKTIQVNINSTDPTSIISAFPKIYSLDKSKLFIPNATTPKISLGETVSETTALSDVSVSAEETNDNSVRLTAGANPLRNSIIPSLKRAASFIRKIIFGSDTSNSEPTPSPTPDPIETQSNIIQFPETTPFNGLKDAGYWGYLDNLYVNFNFFKNVISTPNFDIRNVLYTILNGLSAAAGNIWDFQIQQQTKEDGNLTLSIVDLNFTEKTSLTDIYEFDLMGEQSILMSNTFEMDISGQMMNHIIGKRIGITQSDETDTSKKDSKGIFTDKEDKILPKIQKADLGNTTKKSDETSTDEPTEQEIKDKNLQLFLDNVGIFPRVNNKKVVGGENDLEKLLYFGTYNDKNLFNQLRNSTKISNTETKEEYSILLPVKFSFKIHGISGIKRGDKFKVRGLPDQYSRNGFFQVTAVKHTVSGMKWETDVEGSYRNSLSS